MADHIVSDTLAHDQRDAFFRNIASQWKFAIRPQIRQGDEMVFRCSYDYIRGLGSWRTPLHGLLAGGNDSLVVDGMPVGKQHAGFVGSFDGGLHMGGASSIVSHMPVFDEIAPGDHTIAWQQTARFLVQRPDGSEQLLLAFPLDHQSKLAVLPRGADDLSKVKDESIRPAMKAAIQIKRIHLATGNYSSMIEFNLVAPLPRNIACDIIARHDGHEWTLSRFITSARSTGAMSTGIDLPNDGLFPTSGTVQIILRPSDDALRTTIEPFEVWDGELTFDDVPVVAK